MKAQELAKTSKWKPRPGLELAPESSSPRSRARTGARRAGPGCELEMNGKKIKESEGRIAKRTKFLELKKENPPASRARPLVELAPRGTTYRVHPVAEFE